MLLRRVPLSLCKFYYAIYYVILSVYYVVNMFYPDIYPDIGLVYYAIYYVILSVQIGYCGGRRRTVFLADFKKAVMEFNFIAIQQHLEELLQIQCRPFNTKALIRVIGAHKCIPEIE